MAKLIDKYKCGRNGVLIEIPKDLSGVLRNIADEKIYSKDINGNVPIERKYVWARRLVALLEDPKTSPSVVLATFSLIADRLEGRPSQKVELSDDRDAPANHVLGLLDNIEVKDAKSEKVS